MGVAYDVFGNGKTALKMNLGKYLEGVGVAAELRQLESDASHPDLTGSVRRAGRHPDLDRRQRRFRRPTATCTNPLRQRKSCGGQRWRSDFCGQISNSRSASRPDRQLRSRPPQRLGRACRRTGASASRSSSRLLPRMSIEVGYYRRWFDGFTVNDNLRWQPADLDAVQHHGAAGSAPARMAAATPIGTLYDVVPAKSGQIDNAVDARRQVRRVVSGTSTAWTSRSTCDQGGLTLQGGTSTGQNVADACDVRAQPARAERRQSAPGSSARTSARRQPVLPRRVRRADAASRARHLHDPEDRRAGERGVPEQARAAALRQLRDAGGQVAQFLGRRRPAT